MGKCEEKKTPMKPKSDEKGKYSGIFVEIEQLKDKKTGEPLIHKEGKYRGHPVKKTRSHLFFKGNKELYDKIDRTDNFIITNGISYVGKRRYQDNVAKMYAMAIEIDGIKGLDGVRQLIHTWHRPVTEMDGKKYYNMTPKPTYITCSGRGLHLYFVFEEPIVLYKNINVDKLLGILLTASKKLKRSLAPTGNLYR